jgi:succinoglycan biosynthesis protein ExoA
VSVSASLRVRPVRITAVMVAREEPLTRLRRAIASLALQEGIDGLDIVIAAPAREHRRLEQLIPHGAVSAITLVDNPSGGRSDGLNRAVAVARGDVIVRLDARARVARDYVARTVARLTDDARVGVVGGAQWPVALRNHSRDQGIARALRNRLLMGAAAYRCPERSGPVDTVYLGVYRRDELLRVGGFDARLEANEDFELCQRYRRAGFAAWLESGATIEYEPRDTRWEVFEQYHAFGRAKVQYWRLTGDRTNRRQRVALALGVAGAVAVVASLRRPRRMVAMFTTAALGLAVVDHIADPHERGLRVRAHAYATNMAVVSGWLTGVARGLASRPSRW